MKRIFTIERNALTIKHTYLQKCFFINCLNNDKIMQLKFPVILNSLT